MLRPIHAVAGLVAIASALVGPACAQEPVTVFAAASLRDALTNAAAPFTTASGIQVRMSFAASSALAKQIEQGAPADIFASADLDWMEYLAERKLVRAQTRVNLLGNELVVIAPQQSAITQLKLDAASIAAALGADGRIATGEVKSVPVGKYAKTALEKLGLWGDVNARLAMVENVRAALVLVARGEAPLGIVYATDAAAEPRVKVVAVFPGDSHPLIVYPFAVTTTSANAGATKFLDYLKSASARPLFEAQGFTLLHEPSKPTQ